MKRIILVHRWDGGADDDWRPWLKEELEELGHTVIALDMPDTEVPVIEKWVGHLREAVGVPDSNTYFIGHSIGCQAILRYLETIETSIGGAIFVSGWFSVTNLEDDEVREIAKPWLTIPIDLQKVKKVLPNSIWIVSDNDPYECFSKENQEKFEELGSKIVFLNSAGHITEEDGFTKLPLILEEFNRL